MVCISCVSHVFFFSPRSVTYVYYEQYLTIVNEGVFNICMCLLPTFIVCCILLGMDLRSGFLNLLTIVMITVDTVGVMTLWGIDFNAVSLINLVTVRFERSQHVCVCVCWEWFLTIITFFRLLVYQWSLFLIPHAHLLSVFSPQRWKGQRKPRLTWAVR